jgi:predicted kinase
MKLYLICGPPGSGKTTLAQHMKQEGQIHDFYEADMWMMDEFGHYCFDPTHLGYCHLTCQDAVERALRQNKNVAVSNTTITKRQAEPYINMARKFGAEVEIIHLDRKYPDIHNVPPEKVEYMERTREYFTVEDFKND